MRASRSLWLLLPLLIGCSSYSYLKVTRMSPAQLREVADAELCNAYAQTHAEPRTKQAPIRAEMEARGLLSAAEWQTVAAKRLQVGMSELALIAAWGFPERISIAVAGPDEGPGQHKQFIYERRTASGSVSVYVDDRLVTGWREWVEDGDPAVLMAHPSIHSTPGSAVTTPEREPYSPPAGTIKDPGAR
jgi:hypothetical protein